MKLKTSRTQLDKLIINLKLFQTIKLPEKNKVMSQIPKYLSNLGNSLKLLDASNSKEKINKRKSLRPSKSVLLKNVIQDNRKYLLNNKSNKSNKIEISNNEYINNIKLNNKSRLYTDKLSLLKEKNKAIIDKILKSKDKTEENSINSSNDTINEQKLISSFDFPKIKQKKEDIEMMSTELSENNKNISFQNYQNSLPKIESKSSKLNNSESLNSRNRINSQIIRHSNSFDEKIKNIKFITRNKSDINIKIDQNPINLIDKIKNKEKNDINILNKKLVNLFGYDYKDSAPSSPEISNFIKGIKKLKNNLAKKNCEYELLKWLMNSKMKEAEWKIGINESEKYFVNVDEFRIKEKIESELNKSSDKNLALLINDLKEDKQINEIQEIKKKYGINIKKEEEIGDNNYYKKEKFSDKIKEQDIMLKRTKERKLKEKRNREIIEFILLKSRQRAFNIINS